MTSNDRCPDSDEPYLTFRRGTTPAGHSGRIAVRSFEYLAAMLNLASAASEGFTSGTAGEGGPPSTAAATTTTSKIVETRLCLEANRDPVVNILGDRFATVMDANHSVYRFIEECMKDKVVWPAL